MKKVKSLAVLLVLVFTLALTACTPNMKAYMAETEKVSKWEGTKAEFAMNLNVVTKENGKNVNISLPVSGTAEGQGQEKAKITLNMDLSALKSIVPKEEVKNIPGKVSVEFLTDSKMVYYKKADMVKIMGDQVPAEIKNAKEEYIAMDVNQTPMGRTLGPSEKAMKYLESPEFTADVVKLYETALKDYKPGVDMKVEGSKFSYNATIEQMTDDVINATTKILDNWDASKSLLGAILNKAGDKVTVKDLDELKANIKKEDLTNGAAMAKQALKGSSLAFTTEFGKDTVKQDTKLKLNVEGMTTVTIDAKSTSTKANVKVEMPKSFKKVDMNKLFAATPAENIFLVRVNGEEVAFEDQQPIAKENRTLVPLRGVFEKMGAKVNWDQAKNTVTVNKDGKDIVLTLGSKDVKVGDKTVKLDVPAQAMNNRTMVPVRFVSENFGYKVKFDNEIPGIFFIDIYNISDAELAKALEPAK